MSAAESLICFARSRAKTSSSRHIFRCARKSSSNDTLHLPFNRQRGVTRGVSVMAGPVFDQRRESHIGACDHDGYGPSHIDVGFILGEPIKKQHERVDLIVITATWERQEFAFELCQPWSFYRQQNAGCFEPSLVTTHARFLIILGMSTDDA